MANITEKHKKIITAAQTVFLRYGFKRTTMGDIAKEAGISRPSLYLSYESKEALFAAVAEHMYLRQRDKILAHINEYPTNKEKLFFAFEVWCVEPFTILQASSVDARDLLASGAEVAADISREAAETFEGVIAPLLKSDAPDTISAASKARLLHTAVPGFKTVAQSPEELRAMIRNMIELVED
jgi:AcrR family transcriptional regulator